MTDNKYIQTLLYQSWAVSYHLAHKRLSMWASVVVAVATVLLLLLCLFCFVVYCETMAPDGVATLWNNRLVQNNELVWPAHNKVGAVTKTGWCAYCSDNEICISVSCPSRMCKTWSILWALSVQVFVGHWQMRVFNTVKNYFSKSHKTKITGVLFTGRCHFRLSQNKINVTWFFY